MTCLPSTLRERTAFSISSRLAISSIFDNLDRVGIWESFADLEGHALRSADDEDLAEALLLEDAGHFVAVRLLVEEAVFTAVM